MTIPKRNTQEHYNSSLGGLPRGEMLLSHWMMQEKVKSKLEAWVTLLAMADHDGKTVSIKGKFVELSPGSLLTTQSELAQRWGWNGKKVQRFLDRLKKEGLLEAQSTPNYSILTVRSEGVSDVQTSVHTVDSEKSGTVWITNQFDTQTVYTNVQTSVQTEVPNVSQEEREILSLLHGIAGWKVEFEKDLGYVRNLMVEFPHVDMKEEVTKFATHKLDKPLKEKGNHRLALRNWVKIASERREGSYENHQQRRSQGYGSRYSRSGSTNERSSRFENRRFTRI